MKKLLPLAVLLSSALSNAIFSLPLSEALEELEEFDKENYDNIFNDVSKFGHLNLSGLDIDYLEVNAPFDLSVPISSIDLSGNNIQKLQNTWLEKLPLQSLDLSGNMDLRHNLLEIAYFLEKQPDLTFFKFDNLELHNPKKIKEFIETVKENYL